MAVQKSKKTRSKRGMRRSHDQLSALPLAVDEVSGDVHLFHHVSPDGYYRGREVTVSLEEDGDE